MKCALWQVDVHIHCTHDVIIIHLIKEFRLLTMLSTMTIDLIRIHPWVYIHVYWLALRASCHMYTSHDPRVWGWPCSQAFTIAGGRKADYWNHLDVLGRHLPQAQVEVAIKQSFVLDVGLCYHTSLCWLIFIKLPINTFNVLLSHGISWYTLICYRDCNTDI